LWSAELRQRPNSNAAIPGEIKALAEFEAIETESPKIDTRPLSFP
jgi:hypothetical protein